MYRLCFPCYTCDLLDGMYIHIYIYISIQVQQVYSHKYIYIYLFIYLLPQSLSGLKFADNQGSAGIVSASETATSVISLATLQISCWCVYIYVYIYICQLFNIKWNTFRYLYIYMHICIDKSKRDAGVGTASVFTARSASNLCCMSWKAAAV